MRVFRRRGGNTSPDQQRQQGQRPDRALCSKVSDEVNSQYVIGFYPESPDGKWHSLKVTVSNQQNQKLKISTRKGYQSPRVAKLGK